MYCTRCGKEIRSDQKFCGNCGAKNVNYKEKNDLKEMIEKAAAGEENALEKIYNLTYVQGFAIALQMVKNEQDAMDVMQDTYISAFRNLKQIEDPKRLKSWFNCIVANKCKDWLKKKSQKRNMKRNCLETESQKHWAMKLFHTMRSSTRSVIIKKIKIFSFF